MNIHVAKILKQIRSSPKTLAVTQDGTLFYIDYSSLLSVVKNNNTEENINLNNILFI